MNTLNRIRNLIISSYEARLKDKKNLIKMNEKIRTCMKNMNEKNLFYFCFSNTNKKEYKANTSINA